MRINRTLILLLFLISLGKINYAQEGPWSLEDCISYALENNISIKQMVLTSEYNENLLDQSRMNRLPNLNASSSYDISWGRSINYTTYEYTNERTQNAYGGIASSATLFNGFQQKNSIEKSKFDLLASIENTERIKNDISLNIAAAYLQILFNQELLAVAKNQLEVTALQVERTQKMVDAGKLARGSALEIQAQFASEELNVINSENQLVMSYLTLQLYLDLPYDPDFSIVNPDLPLPESAEMMDRVSEIYSSAEQEMPQIKGARYSLESARMDLEIAKGARYPTLGISANSFSRWSDQPIIPGSDPDPFGDQISNNLAAGVGLELNIPIFNKFQIKNNIANAKIQIETAELDLQQSRNDLYQTIQQSYIDAVAALKKYTATEKALISMEESFKYTEKKFEVGLVNTVDYNTSKNQLTRTQSDLLQAKYDYIFKTKILNFYRGEEITL